MLAPIPHARCQIVQTASPLRASHEATARHCSCTAMCSTCVIMTSPPRCRLTHNAPEAAGAGGEALEQAVEAAAAAWDEASNGERAPFEEQAEGELLLGVWNALKG
jgi:hypothetical protein